MSKNPTDCLKAGRKLMLRCEIVDDYECNCVIRVRLPNGKEEKFYLNDFKTHDLKPYVSWEGASDGKDMSSVDERARK